MFEPGNTLASKHGKWRANLERAIAQDDGKRLRGAAEKLLDLANAGEAWAVKELADRLDGRPAQAVTLLGDADNPLAHKVTVEYINASDHTASKGT